MCLILFALDAHPTYKLVLAANRDEFTPRPAHKAHWWHYYPDVLGGLDLEAGGTWLGITKTGRCTALTNFRDISNINPDAPSRGELTHKFLTHRQMPMADFSALLERKGTQYNGFNILWGDICLSEPDMYWYSNYTSETYNRTAIKIPSGVHGLSNALLDTPWYKVEHGKAQLQTALDDSANATPDALTNSLVQMLQDRTRPDDTNLPKTGVSLEWERTLSSMFIEAPQNNYGTRCSTILLVDRMNTAHFTEVRYTPAFDGGVLDTQIGASTFSFAFSLLP
jgi:uncharacterized protein with NRDE domain